MDILKNIERQRLSAEAERVRSEKRAQNEVLARQAASREADRAAAAAKADKMLNMSSNRAKREREEARRIRKKTGGSAASKARREAAAKQKEATAKAERRLKRQNIQARAAAGEPPKALPGFEFVQERKARRQAIVPDTTDYSDMFPEQLTPEELAGGSHRATEAAAAENRRIVAERRRATEEHMKKSALDLQDDGRRASDSRWVAIDASTAAAAFMNKAAGRVGSVHPSTADRGAAGAARFAGSTRPGSGTSVSAIPALKPATGRVSKATKKVIKDLRVKETESKAEALRAMILKSTGGSSESLVMKTQVASPDSKKAKKRDSRDSKVGHKNSSPRGDRRGHRERRGYERGVSDERSGRPGKRKRWEDEGDDDEELGDGYYESDRGRRDGRSRGRRDSVYSDYESGDDDDDDDDGFGMSFADVMAEEEEAAEAAAAEDLFEKKRLARLKKEKLTRKAEWERRRR